MSDFADKEELLQIIKESWLEVTSKEKAGDASLTMDAKGAGKGSAGASDMTKSAATASKSGGYFTGKWWSGAKNVSGNKASTHLGKEEDDGATRGQKQFDIPETFDDMCRLNASMTGANAVYINIMLDEIGILVEDVCASGELREQTDILSMRIVKDCGGKVKLNEFKTVLLASLRSLIPGRWDTKHEKAWSWLWESISTQLEQSLALPTRYEKPVVKWAASLSQDELRDLCMSVWKRLFVIDAEAENVFKQSNERLIFIARMAIEFSAKIYGEPTKMKADMQELGLKHIFHRVDPKYFPVFVKCMDEEIKSRTDDMTVAEGIKWSLSIIASILGRTVEAGSTPVLKAALDDRAKATKMLLGQTARGKRAQACISAETGIDLST